MIGSQGGAQRLVDLVPTGTRFGETCGTTGTWVMTPPAPAAQPGDPRLASLAQGMWRWRHPVHPHHVDGVVGALACESREFQGLAIAASLRAAFKAPCIRGTTARGLKKRWASLCALR